MLLNNIKPAKGSKQSKKRVARGIGCGNGKTAGRGHKGQKSRAGGFHKVGFEGGQMPLQRRLPKRGFNSRVIAASIRLSDLNNLPDAEINRLTLVSNGLVSTHVEKIKIINTGKLERAVVIRGIGVTVAAKAAIIAAGGTVD